MSAEAEAKVLELRALVDPVEPFRRWMEDAAKEEAEIVLPYSTAVALLAELDR